MDIQGLFLQIDDFFFFSLDINDFFFVCGEKNAVYSPSLLLVIGFFLFFFFKNLLAQLCWKS